MAAGNPLGLAPGSPNRIRRIEGGVLDYGSDMTPAENPLELGMERLVDFSKPDFIGKAALEAIRDAGVMRKVHGVFMDGDTAVANFVLGQNLVTREHMFLGKSNDHTFLIIYGLPMEQSVMLNTHIVSADASTQCIEAHVSKISTSEAVVPGFDVGVGESNIETF